MQTKTFAWAMFVALALTFVALPDAIAGDVRQFQQKPDVGEPETWTDIPEGKIFPQSSGPCKTEIDDYKMKEYIDLDKGYGYEEALLGKWEGHYWSPGPESGAVFNIHMTKVVKREGRATIYSYYTMRQRSDDGCGTGPLTRWPSEKEIEEHGQRYNHTRLHRHGTFDHTHWEHPFNLYRVKRWDGEINYYLVAETKFGQNVKGGPWATTVTLEAINEETVERLEEIYFEQRPWLKPGPVSEAKPSTSEGQVSQAD